MQRRDISALLVNLLRSSTIIAWEHFNCEQHLGEVIILLDNKGSQCGTSTRFYQTENDISIQ